MNEATCSKGGLRRAMVVVALIGTAAAALGIGVRATFGAHVSVDEPQYLLTALSLFEDGSLDISDEIAQGRWRAYSDVALPVQTAVLAGGRELSPHDPLLAALLAVPMGLGGWMAAKASLALVGGVLGAALVWVAVRRFGVPLPLAASGAVLVTASPPLAVYGQQVYPELPAALAVTLAIGALTGPLERASLVSAGACIVALPWLSVKYVPVAGVIAAIAGFRLFRAKRHPDLVVFVSGLAVMAAGYLAGHRLIWGGWTAYASGDHFQQSGEFGVLGFHPDFVGRSLRLVGLLVDRDFGIAAWQPAWLLIIPAAVALARWWSPRNGAVLVILATGWAVATWVALTMHGYWWPGRQLVVVLPLAALAVMMWLSRLPTGARLVGLALGSLGVVAYAWLLVDGYAGAITWVVDFQNVRDPVYQSFRVLLPDYRGEGLGLWVRHAAWIAGFAALAVFGWRSARFEPPPPALKESRPVLISKGMSHDTA